MYSMHFKNICELTPSFHSYKIYVLCIIKNMWRPFGRQGKLSRQIIYNDVPSNLFYSGEKKIDRKNNFCSDKYKHACLFKSSGKCSVACRFPLHFNAVSLHANYNPYHILQLKFDVTRITVLQQWHFCSFTDWLCSNRSVSCHMYTSKHMDTYWLKKKRKWNLFRHILGPIP